MADYIVYIREVIKAIRCLNIIKTSSELKNDRFGVEPFCNRFLSADIT